MSFTKRQFVEHAFEEIGYATYAFDLDPEQYEIALRRLDSMLSTWNGRGIRIGYPIPSSPESSDLDQETGVPDSANEAIYLNLAIRIAPTVGKTVAAETKQAARSAYMELLSKHVMPREMQLPGTMPSGSGNKPTDQYSQFLDPPTDDLDAGSDGAIEFN